MRTALYFPHTEIKSKNLLRSALLTWDKIEYIAPFQEYKPEYNDNSMRRAMELIGSKRTPSKAERNLVHAAVEELLQEGIPETFRYSPSPNNAEPEYEIWPQKLANKTWELIEDRGLTGERLENLDYSTTKSAGLTLMAIIADVLAGNTRTRITDRSIAYATIANTTKSNQVIEGIDLVVPLTFKSIGVEHVPIERLIEFREREEKEQNGIEYRALRHSYLEAVEAHIERIAKVPIGSKDREELDRMFEDDMENDLSELKDALGFSKRDILLSKETITLVLAGSTLLTAAIGADFQIPDALAGSGAVVTLGGALWTGNKLARSRKEILKKHPMAYLYELNSQ